MGRLIEVKPWNAIVPKDEPTDIGFLQGIYAYDLKNYYPIEDVESHGWLKTTKTPETELIEKQKLDSLSTEAIKVIKILFEAPIEIMTLTTNDVGLLKLKKYLKKTQGWSHRKISKILTELKNYYFDK